MLSCLFTLRVLLCCNCMCVDLVPRPVLFEDLLEQTVLEGSTPGVIQRGEDKWLYWHHQAVQGYGKYT